MIAMGCQLYLSEAGEEIIVIKCGRNDNDFGVGSLVSGHGPVFSWVPLCKVLISLSMFISFS